MTFRELHEAEAPLVLPNAWDVPSAIMLCEAGFPAIGTTSFGVAASSGVPDGTRCTRDATRGLAHALRRLSCYVTVDAEDGYSDDPDEVAANVALLRVDGVNLEDSTAERLVAPDAFARKVTAVKARTPDVFVNARIDTYWLDQDANLDATVARARAYADAGADGVFVPRAPDLDTIRAIAAEVALPLNVLAMPGTSLAELGAAGVRRVSTGSLPYRAALRAAVDVALAVRDDGTPPPAASYADLQARLLRYTDESE